MIKTINKSNFSLDYEFNVELLVGLYDMTKGSTLLKEWKVTKLYYPSFDEKLIDLFREINSQYSGESK
jgi:hypothetical protein